MPTFFCKRTTLVHFFSKSVSYFLQVAASKLSPIFNSSRNAATLFGRFAAERYAIMDLCLPKISCLSRIQIAEGLNDLQLLSLPRRQDLAHGDCGRYMKLEGFPFAISLEGDAPG
jgi:hypothetical protein